MSDWVKVPAELFVDVAAVLSTAAATASQTGLPLDLPRELVDGLLSYLGEDLGCDHSVNICTCQAQELVYSLNLALTGEQICPRCHGEGMIDDPAKPDWPMTCPRCFTSGIARIETEA